MNHLRQTLLAVAACVAILACDFSATASLVALNFTNALGQLDTNRAVIFTLDANNPVASDGTIITSGGLPFPIYPPTTNYFMVGNYFVTNSVLRQGYAFRCPDSSSNLNSYPISSGNTFVTVIQVYSTNTITTNPPTAFDGSTITTNGSGKVAVNGAAVTSLQVSNLATGSGVLPEGTLTYGATNDPGNAYGLVLIGTNRYRVPLTNSVAYQNALNAATNAANAATNVLGSAAYTSSAAYDVAGAANAAFTSATNAAGTIANSKVFAATNALDNGSLVRTNSTGVNLSGTFSGNGAGLQLQPEAYAFATNISIPTQFQSLASTRLAGYEQEKKNWGIWTNFVDAVIQNPRLTGTSNNVSFLGRPLTWTNATLGSWGAQFQGSNGLHCGIILTNIGGKGLRTNTLVMVVRQPIYNSAISGNAGGPPATLANSTDYSCTGMVFPAGASGLMWWGQRSGTTGQPTSFTNIVVGVGSTRAGYDRTGNDLDRRNVWILSSDGNGNMQVWRDGVLQYLNYYSGNTTNMNCFVTNTADLNTLVAGGDIQRNLWGPMVGGTVNDYVGQVDCVEVYNCAATPNLVKGIMASTRWLEPSTEDDYFIGDSRTAGNDPVPTTNTLGAAQWPYYMTYGRGLVDGTWENIAWNGDGYQYWGFPNYGTGIFAPTNYILAYPAPACVTTIKVFDGYGINDYYNAGATGSYVYGFRTNIAATLHAADSRFKYYPLLTWGLATNASSPYAYSSATESNVLVGNFLVLSNSYLFDGVPRTDFRIPQNWLTPVLNLYSVDGLHFYGTNGVQAQQVIAQEVANPTRTCAGTNVADYYVPEPFIFQFSITNAADYSTQTNVIFGMVTNWDNAQDTNQLNSFRSNTVTSLTVSGPGSVALTTNQNGITAAVTLNSQTNATLTQLSTGNGNILTNLNLATNSPIAGSFLLSADGTNSRWSQSITYSNMTLALNSNGVNQVTFNTNGNVTAASLVASSSISIANTNFNGSGVFYLTNWVSGSTYYGGLVLAVPGGPTNTFSFSSTTNFGNATYLNMSGNSGLTGINNYNASGSGQIGWANTTVMGAPSHGTVSIWDGSVSGSPVKIIFSPSSSVSSNWPAIKTESLTNNIALSIRNATDTLYENLVLSNLTAWGTSSITNGLNVGTNSGFTVDAGGNVTASGTVTAGSFGMSSGTNFSIGSAGNGVLGGVAITNSTITSPSTITVQGNSFYNNGNCSFGYVNFNTILGASGVGNLGISAPNIFFNSSYVLILSNSVFASNTVTALKGFIYGNLSNTPAWWGASNQPLIWSSNNVSGTAVPAMYRTYYDAGTNAHTTATGF